MCISAICGAPCVRVQVKALVCQWWTAAHKAPLSTEFSRQESWS